MEQSFKKYMEHLGARLTLRQKNRFMNEIVTDMKEFGYESTLINGKRGFHKAKNLFFGNIKHAKVVVCVPYDTPQKYFWPNPKYYPLNGNRSNIKELFPVYGPAVLLYLIMFLTIQFTPVISADTTVQAVLIAFTFLMLGGLCYYLFHGFTNRKNVNRNSLSIVAALEIASQLQKDDKRKVAFLFTDKNKHKHVGAVVAVEDFMKQNRNPNIICLNCFGVGDVLAIGYNPNTKKLAQEINRNNTPKWKQIELDENKRFQSMMEHYQKAVMISAGYLDEKGDLTVNGTGTSKDSDYKEENLTAVVKALQSYIKTL